MMNDADVEHVHDRADALERLLADQRGRLVRLRALLAGDADAAENLAQETPVIAWICRERLRCCRLVTPSRAELGTGWEPRRCGAGGLLTVALVSIGLLHPAIRDLD